MEASSLLFPVAMAVVLVAIVPLVGVFSAFVPYLMPKRECFAVTVPDDAQHDPQIRALKRRYTGIMLLLTAVCTAACVLAWLLGSGAATGGTSGDGPAMVVVAVMVASVLGICIASYGLMLYFRTKVKALKTQRGWVAVAGKAASPIGGEVMPHALSLKWDALFLPLILACLAVCFLGYGNIPEQIPSKIGAGGEVVSYFQKSYLAAAFPALLVVFIDGILMFSHWQILHAKKFVDPAMPAASSWAYGMFARAQSVMLVAGGVLMGFVGLAMALAFVGAITMMQAAAWTLVVALIVVVSTLAVSVVYGQNGSRLIAKVGATGAGATGAVAAGAGALLRDNDRYWKLGVFYFNRQDASLFLPERFGIGWTMNWARPAAWAIVVGLVAVVVALIAFAFMLQG